MPRALVDMGIHKMPEPNPPDKDYWPTEAIEPLLAGLSKADWVRLNKAAAYRSIIVSGDPDDLLQEALVRVGELNSKTESSTPIKCT